MRQDPAPVWRLADPAHTRVRRFDDEALVFNPVSWQTHLVGSPGAWLIEALASGPKRESELAAALIDETEAPADNQAARDALRALLEELRGFGLVAFGPNTP